MCCVMHFTADWAFVSRLISCYSHQGAAGHWTIRNFSIVLYKSGTGGKVRVASLMGVEFRASLLIQKLAVCFGWFLSELIRELWSDMVGWPCEPYGWLRKLATVISGVIWMQRSYGWLRKLATVISGVIWMQRSYGWLRKLATVISGVIWMQRSYGWLRKLATVISGVIWMQRSGYWFVCSGYWFICFAGSCACKKTCKLFCRLRNWPFVLVNGGF